MKPIEDLLGSSRNFTTSYRLELGFSISSSCFEPMAFEILAIDFLLT